jgi:LCP family protein required for cell wall assembly
MNKAKGCFIAVVVVFFIGLLLALIFILPNITQSDEERVSSDTDGGGFSLSLGAKNYLFAGIDEREGSEDFKGRTDTIMIYHISDWGKKDLLISIPRDTRVNLDGHGWNKINAAYVYGGEGMLKDEIYELTDIRVDKTMLINFDGFIKIIDALGGVEITVDEPMHDPLSGADFEPGTYVMSGEEALAFARNRKTSKGDFDRVDRQKYLISEVLRQKLNASIIFKAPELISIFNEETKSDFSTIDYLTFGTILLFSDKDIERITLPGQSQTIDGISYVIVDEEEAKEFLRGYMD